MDVQPSPSWPMTARDQGVTAVDLARKFQGLKLTNVVQWASESQLRQRFEDIRDYRWLVDASRPGFLRRPAWLYPDDGCYSRAALMNSLLSQWNAPVPNKVFVFGDLRLYTHNTRVGMVTWWYHVAPLVEVHGQKYVLDPSVEPQYPLTLREWLSRMSDKPDDLQVAVCNPNSYSPYDNCNRGGAETQATAQRDQVSFLNAEWFRLEELRRNPYRELGDNPPWKH